MSQGLMYYNNSKKIRDITTFNSAMVETNYVTSIIAVDIAGKTLKYNTQCREFINELSDIANRNRDVLQSRIDAAQGQTYTGMRDKGVKLAWRYEKADVEMGGKGSSNWSEAQRKEILSKGKVRGQEGHHINSVAEHPDEQTNPNNIRFLSRKKHLEHHNGDFRNSTSGKMIDKNKMLQRTNFGRVIKNEIIGISAAAAIGFGIGFSISVVTSLAVSGFNPDSIKIALITGTKMGVKSAMISTVGYTIGRIVTCAVQKVLQKLAISLTENLSKAVCAGITGSITIMAFAVIEFYHLRKDGKTVKDAVLCAMKHALLSFKSLCLVLYVGYIFSPVVGALLSLAMAGGTVARGIISTKKDLVIREKVMIMSIEYMKPSFIGG